MVRNNLFLQSVFKKNSSKLNRVKKYILVFIAVLSFTFQIEAQADIMEKDRGAWNTLSMVTFERTFDEEFGIDIEKPIISPLIQALNGKEIVLEGYIIPLTGKIEQSHFMLSKFTQSMCFFCGKAGPESAAQVFTKDGKKIPFTDKKVKVKGILRVNVTDAMIEDGVMINN